jgi:hypothetical protein
MRQIVEKCWEQIVHVRHLNFDFQVAYDIVLGKEMWSEMNKLGFPAKLVKLCKI